MKAVINTKYGRPENLKLVDLPVPQPGENEILIRIYASTVTAGDCEIRRWQMPWIIWLPFRIFMGFRKPRINIYGQEFSGVVEKVGKGVKKFKPGDEIFGPTDMYLGAYAEYKVMKEDAVLGIKPENLDHGEAATISTGGMNALYFLQKGGVHEGQSILINGAGGVIGSYGIQLAKYFGLEVTAVDSTNKLEMLREAGADHVIDYTTEDWRKSGKKYDIIFDSWSKGKFFRNMKCLNKKGKLIIANPALSLLYLIPMTRMLTGKRMISGVAPYRQADLDYLTKLMSERKIHAIIDREYPLEELAKAHQYVEDGGKKGHLVIRVS